MTYFVYGCLGVLAVLALLSIGAFLGWRLRVAYDRHNRKVVQEGVTEEQLKRFRMDQEAFDAMMNYSTEVAYGLPETKKE